LQTFQFSRPEYDIAGTDEQHSLEKNYEIRMVVDLLIASANYGGRTSDDL